MTEPMTMYGYEKITAELKDLKTVQRPAIVQEIDIARSHGDLKENAEYHAAKRERGRNESRIRYLRNMIKTAKIIGTGNNNEETTYGLTITGN